MADTAVRRRSRPRLAKVWRNPSLRPLALKIDTVFARVLPDQKASKIEEVQRQGTKVAMAVVMVLVRSDPRDIARIITLSKATYRKMIQSLWWAVGYNIVAIPLAAGVLSPWGIMLNPAVGAILMSLSTVVVAANAQFLQRTSL